MGYEVPSKVVIVFPSKPEVILKERVISEGYVISNGSEQTVMESSEAGVYEGYIDLSTMASEDVVVLRRYVRLEEGGEFKLHSSSMYSGSQEEPIIRFTPITVKYGIKITFQQTSGTLGKLFRYQFFKVPM